MKDEFFIKAKTFSTYKEKEEVWRSLEAILTLVTIIVLSAFAISPTVKAISELLSEIENKKELSVSMKKKIDMMVQAQINYANIQRDLEIMDLYYPYDPQLVLGISQVAGVVQENGFLLGNLDLEKVTLNFGTSRIDKKVNVKRDAIPIGFNVVTNGDYWQIRKVLQKIFTGGRAIKIASYGIFKEEEEEEKEKSSLKFNFYGYLLYEPKEEQDGN